jgi:DNA adenine methylase
MQLSLAVSPAEEREAPCTPFLKWAGGKRWLVKRHLSIFPVRYNCFIEPFLGSGAVFFALRPKSAILGDTNGQLIETYSALQKDWQRVVRSLERHATLHSDGHFYKIRARIPPGIFARAARFIYLNRTCWNGLYRVNTSGKFNVPVGTKDRVLLEVDDFEGIRLALGKATLLTSDFAPVIEMAKEGDLVFADPPYTVKHDNNGFIKYNEQLFSWDDQVRLRDCLLKAKQKGVHVVVTNADNHWIRELYTSHFESIRLERNSIIAGDSKKRGKCSELAFRG